MLEVKIRKACSRLSNNEPIKVEPEWIDECVEMIREALHKQFFRKKEKFRPRMSNISRPSCQLQMEKRGKPKARLPYNFIVRMLHGDIIEAVMQLILRASGANITGGKNKVKLDLDGTEVRGEDDIEIDGKIFDVKSASPWAFKNKWSSGLEGLREADDFGYVGQLVGYSVAQNKKPGGWIVVDKSSGEINVVEAPLRAKDTKDIIQGMKDNLKALDGRFKRCFESEEEFFRKKPTGSKKLPATCGFCPFIGSCWPKAQNLPMTLSQAQNPKHFWYTEYAGKKL